MITLNGYQRDASGTAIYPGRMSPHGMMYCALKMNGEAGELAEHVVNAKFQAAFTPAEIDLIVKEIGDVAWYCAAMCDELRASLGDVYFPRHTPITGATDKLVLKLNAETGKIAELIGKAMRDEGYGMPSTYTPGALREGEKGNGMTPSNLLSDDRYQKIAKHLEEIIEILSAIADNMGTNLGKALELNLKKLADRKARGTLQGSGDNR